MPVPIYEVFRFLKAKLKASNPGKKVYQDKLPKDITEGYVFRYTGSPIPTMASDGETLGEDIVIEICYHAVGPDASVVKAGAEGILTALEGQSGNTAEGEIFGLVREHVSHGSRELSSGQFEQKLGWKFRFYARADA